MKGELSPLPLMITTACTKYVWYQEPLDLEGNRVSHAQLPALVPCTLHTVASWVLDWSVGSPSCLDDFDGVSQLSFPASSSTPDTLCLLLLTIKGPWRVVTTPVSSGSTKTSGSNAMMPSSPRPASRTCWIAKGASQADVGLEENLSNSSTPLYPLRVLTLSVK